jgi:hypothetical protein
VAELVDILTLVVPEQQDKVTQAVILKMAVTVEVAAAAAPEQQAIA